MRVSVIAVATATISFCTLAFADPVLLSPPEEAQGTPPMVTASAQQPQVQSGLGGGFIEFIFGDAGQRPRSGSQTWYGEPSHGDYYGREQARFALHLQRDPQRALNLAQRNWQMQREPWDARALLEAAQAARQPQAALPVLTFLEQTKLQDPIIEPLARQLRLQLKNGTTPAP